MNGSQQFFRLLSNAEDIKIVMQFYEKYVPNVYIPESTVISEILRAIDLYDAYHYLPQLWEDYKNFEYVTNVRLTEELFSLLSKPKEDKNLQKTFSKIGFRNHCF